MSTNISILKKDEVVEFYKNKKEWTIDEVEAFENKLIEVYNNDSTFFNEILGFNDKGYGKYSVMGKSPFVKELNDFCIVNIEGLLKQFKKKINSKK